MEHEALVHTRTELDRVLVNVEAAMKVRKRADFFCWVQGVFQGMIPHEALVCGLPQQHVGGLRFEWLASYPIADDRFRELCRTDGGLLQKLVAAWEQGGRAPLSSSRVETRHAPPRAPSLIEELSHLELANALAHGLPGLDGQPTAFFAFFKLPAPAGSRETRMLELLVPYLYAAWLRANCDTAVQTSVHTVTMRDILTLREVEVLNWVERGKSNNEIAQILNISHLTVKNHVQSILRKLNVQNRAQAVAKGINLNLTRSADYGGRQY